MERKVEITQEQFDKVTSISPTGMVPDSLLTEFFCDAIIFGRGVYMPRVYSVDGKYILSYSLGE